MVLTAEQQAFLEENFGKLNERDLFQKLSEIGPKADESIFADCLKAIAEKAEAGVFSQKVSEEELAGTVGGLCGVNGGSCNAPAEYKANHCNDMTIRHIYEGAFANCAATVEDGSWCGSNDACYSVEVNYVDMKDCSKAWQ